MPRDAIPLELRRRVRTRAKHRCEYCHYPQVACYASFHCDHFVPRTRGGMTRFENLVFACPTCNGSKRALVEGFDTATGETVRLFNPRLDSWGDHFRWSANGLKLIGRTPTGRATISTLRINRRGVSVVRTMLLELGLHPMP